MILLLIGDPHFRPSALTTGIQLFYWVEKIAQMEKVDAMINLGDTFDTHGVIRSEVLCEFDAHLKRVNDLKIPYFWVLGNHECYKANNSKYNVLEPFKNKYKHIHPITDPQLMEGIYFFPYTHDPIDISSIQADLAITHNTFAGCYFDKARMAESGYSPNDFLFKEIISGHIHKRQQIGKVFFPGTPYAQSAAEVDEVKGVTIHNTLTMEKKFIQSPFQMWRSIRVDLESAQDLELNEVDKFIITLIGTKATVSNFLSGKVAEDIKKRYSVVFKSEVTDRLKDSRVKIDSQKNFSEIVDTYMNKVYSAKVDKEKVAQAIFSAEKLMI